MKKIILFGIILSLLLPTMTIGENKYNEQELLCNMVKDLGGECVELDSVFNSVILNRFLEEEEMVLLAEDIKIKLGIIGTEIDPLIVYEKLPEKYYAKEIIFDEDFSQITYYGSDIYKNSITMIISSYFDKDISKGETYLCINIVKDSDFLKNNDIIESIAKIFKSYDNPVEVSTNLVGEIQGDYSYNIMKNKLNKTLKKYRGNVIEEYTDESLLSLTAYTPLIEEYLLVGEKKINLNLAIRYNKYEDKMYIFIGTPIITNGY